MKKNFLYTLIFAAICMTVSQTSVAQVYMYDRGGRPAHRDGRGMWSNGRTYYGVRVGLSAAKVKSEATYLESNSFRSGLVAGFVVGQQITPNAPVLFESGLFYAEKGGKSDYGGDFSYNLNYLEVPLTFKYAVPVAPNLTLQPLIGGYFGLGVGGYVKDFEKREAYHSFGSSDYQFKRFDGGLKIGCALSVQMFYAELSYNIGLANIGHDMFDETHNRGISLTVGVNF